MARMHSRKKGKSGSTKPIRKIKPSWLRYKEKEVELLIVKLSKEGKNASLIGTTLRDVYGVPSTKTVLGKRINDVLKEKHLLPKLPEDLMALIKKSVAVRKHAEAHKQDMTALRGVQLTDSKIRRLMKYYKQRKVLDPKWKYDPENVSLYLE
ncbi:30S ribosomal protein S15 [Candidatus Woesearchaeota archaeon]|nr:30S ribosomal protein S15 [Candidatus Woesearchaeota archaeon]